MNMTLIYADRSRYEFRFVKTKKVIQNFFITAIHQTLVYTFKVGLCVGAQQLKIQGYKIFLAERSRLCQVNWQNDYFKLCISLDIWSPASISFSDNFTSNSG